MIECWDKKEILTLGNDIGIRQEYRYLRRLNVTVKLSDDRISCTEAPQVRFSKRGCSS